MKTSSRFVIASLCVLTACGGGGGDSGVTPAPVVPASLVVSGTAATGAALAGATIDVRCASGTASTTSAADGTFSATIASGTLPCVVRATSGATVLHSIASGSGAAARVNVTPVTELIVARLIGGLPSDYFAAFGASAAGALSGTALSASAGAIAASLGESGLSFAGVGDLLAGPLVAAHGAVAGDGYDRVLDNLRLAQTAGGTTFSALLQAAILASPDAPLASRSLVASLPPERLLAAATSNCSGLRSGRYRLIVSEAASAPAQTVVVYDAAALSLRDPSTTAAPAVLTPSGPCSYLNPAGGELSVSKAGVVIGRATGPDLLQHSAIALPEQTHSLAELAGAWNYVTLERSSVNASPHLTSGTFTFDGLGRATAQDFCDDMKTCVPMPTAQVLGIQMTVDTAGGFDVANATSGSTDRLFAYRAGGGEMMLVQVAANGRVVYYTRQAAAALPPLGRTQELMNVFVSSLYTAPAALSLSKNTVTSIDATAGRFVRAAVQNFTTGATRPETLIVNDPRSGFVRRVAGAAVHTDGSASNVLEFVSLSMRGMDVGVLGLTASNQLDISTPIVSSTP